MGRRQDLIDTARRMFRDAGYRATGIDSILAESGAAKATLYNHFRSKDKLVLAVLDAEREELDSGLEAAMEAAASGPERVLALFDFAAAWFARPEFNGCAFANAAAEFADPKDEIRGAIREHKQAFREKLAEEVSQLKLPEAGKLAMQLQLLFEGAVTIAKIDGDPGAALAAREAAERLLTPDTPQLRLF